MKEIKFRGICNAGGEFHGKWVYGDLLQKNGKKYITPHANAVSVNGHLGKIIIMHEVDPETVGQYTPLKDKNGKEIYEEDILDHRTYVYKDRKKGVVCFDSKEANYKVAPRQVYECNDDNGEWTGYSLDAHIASDAEVIGNIHEHPDLLGEAVQG